MCAPRCHTPERSSGWSLGAPGPNVEGRYSPHPGPRGPRGICWARARLSPGPGRGGPGAGAEASSTALGDPVPLPLRDLQRALQEQLRGRRAEVGLGALTGLQPWTEAPALRQVYGSHPQGPLAPHTAAVRAYGWGWGRRKWNLDFLEPSGSDSEKCG